MLYSVGGGLCPTSKEKDEQELGESRGKITQVGRTKTLPGLE